MTNSIHSFGKKSCSRLVSDWMTTHFIFSYIKGDNLDRPFQILAKAINTLTYQNINDTLSLVVILFARFPNNNNTLSAINCRN